MKNKKLNEVERYLKRILKNKVKISKGLVLAFLMNGVFSSFIYGQATWVSTEYETGETGVNREWTEKKHWKRNDREGKAIGNVILAPIKPNHENTNRYSGVNTNVSKSVIIGPMAAGRNEKNSMTVVGFNAIGWDNQATALGNNVYAGEQGTAVGSDVMAAGYASIAIGNDDIYSQGGYADTLPMDTILEIYGYKNNDNKTSYKSILSEDEFKIKYGVRSNVDNRHYSPTYSAGIGAIAIGSRSVAYGDTSLALGTLSFALAKGSTALGVRAFVEKNAIGGVAIGDESRVFAENSFAIGNEAEATNTGAISYGSGSKAVGDGSIAIGTKVGSNVKLTEDSSNDFREKLMKKLEIGTVTENERLISAHTKETTATVNDLKTGDDNEIVKSGFSANLDKNIISDKIESLIKDLKLDYEEESKEELSITTSNGSKKSIKRKSKDGKHAITIGYHTINSGENTIAIGTASYVKGKNSVVLGALNNVGKYASNTIAIGVGTNVHKENSIALGTGTTITAAGAVGIGSGVGITAENSVGIGYGVNVSSKSSLAFGNDSKIKENSDSSVALGNNSEVTMQNSVALGYRSTTKYFYDGIDKSKATLSGSDAINLPAYFPEGSSYARTTTDTASGVISVGGWDNKNNQVGFRRIVNVAPGALDSDAATVGQLKTLAYVKKEGIVTYYTTDTNGETQKLVRDESDKKFYRVDVSNGEPLKNYLIDDSKVVVGPKGTGEKIIDLGGSKQSADMGSTKFKFGHIADGEIKDKSDQAITGNQINELIGILGIENNKNTDMTVDYTKLNKKSFEAVEYVGNSSKGVESTHRGAIEDLISAVNSGYVFSDGSSSTNSGGANRNDIPAKFYLGSKVEIKAGDIPKQSSGNQATTPQYLAKNLKTKLSTNDKKSDAIFEIGFSDTPTFKNIQVTDDIPEPITDKDKTKYENYVVNKKYLDKRLSNVAANFDVKGDNFKADNNKTKYTLDKNNTELNIKGKADSSNANHKNITTSVSKADKSVTIELNSTLKGITSIGKDNDNKIVFDVNSQNSPIIKLGGIDLTLDKTANKVRISNVANGVSANDAVNFAQLEAAKLHFVSVKHPSGAESKENYGNDGAKGANAIAIGVGAKANAENTIAMGYNSKIEAEISNSVAIGANNHLRGVAGRDNKDQYKHTVAIGSDNIITGRKIVNLGSGNKIGNTEDNYKATKNSGAVSIRLIGDDNIAHGVWNTVIGEGNKIAESNFVQVMGDKNKVTNSDYAIVISSNKGSTNDTAINSKYAIVMGNNAQAKNANSSVVIGQNAKSKAENTVVLGKGAIVQARANGAVAVGNGATVSTNAGDSIAIGKGSQATAKEEAKNEAKTSNNVKFTYSGGTGVNKTVFSIGNSTTNRIIKNVAAGAVTQNSTDAINGSQLYAVADEFSKLAIDVLGVQKADGDTAGFKKSQFTVLKTTSSDSDSSSVKTFKNAIDDNIDKINKGFVFGSGDSEKGTHYLGDSLIIKAGNIDKPKDDSDGFSSNNIKTHYEEKSKNILIGIKDKPEFKEVTVSADVTDGSNEKVLTTKKYVTEKLALKADKFDKGNLVGSGLIEVTGGDNAVIGKEVSIDLNKATKDKIALIGTGKIEDNNTGTVTGKTVYEYMQGFSTSLILSKDGKEDTETINLKTDKLQVEGQNGINVEIKDKKITFKIDENSKGKIDDILTKTEAGTNYAKIDASNISGDNITKWRTALDVYSKTETKEQINKATFGLKGNDSSNVTKNVNNVIEIKGAESTTDKANNIYVSKEGEGLKIELGKTLTGITSIGKDTNNGITFSENTTSIKLGGIDLSLNKNADRVKISNVANGIDDNDAINKSQLNSVVMALGGNAKIKDDGTLEGPNYKLVNGKATNNSNGNFKSVEEALKALDAAITTANSSTTTLKDASFKFSDGSDSGNVFERKNSDTDKQVIIKGNDNVKVDLSIDDTKNKGTFTVSLEKKLKGIESIEKDDKSKISFNTNEIELKLGDSTKYRFGVNEFDLGNKQIKSLASGLGDTSTNTNVIENILNGTLEVDTSSTTKISNNAVNVKDLSDVSKAIIEKGYKYDAVENKSGEKDKNKSIALGSTISIVNLGYTKSPTPAQPTATENSKPIFSGNNLITQYTYDNGNAKIEIGFKDSPIFKSVSLSEEQKYDSSKSLSENEKKELITKDYLEQALNSFKIKVKANGGKDIELGRGDTLNLENGLNIEVGLKKGTDDSNNSSTPSTTTQPASTTTTTPTTAVATIGTTKDLTGLTSIETEEENGKSSLLDSHGLIVGDDNNNSTTLSKDGVLIEKENNLTNEQTAESNTLTNEESQTVVKAGEISINDSTGANKVRIDDKSITFAENSGKITGLQDANLDENSTEAVNGGQLVKATGAKIIEDTTGSKKMVFADGKDGKSGIEAESMANKGLTSKDGLNGKNANDKANALRNGEAGTVVYTDNEGNRLVKATDGKYYKVSDVNEDGTIKSTDGIKPIDKPTLTLVSPDGTNTTPMQLSNVSSGLGIDEKTNNSVISVEDATKAVSDTLLTKKGMELQKATNLADLQVLAVAGVNYKGDTGETIHKNLGETLDIVGANSNVSVDSKDNKLQITLNDKLTNMKSIDFKEGVMTGLKDLNDTDPGHYAVNKNYVDKKLEIANQGIDKALSGVANAIAMANITQVSGNSGYRHQVGASYGTYGKEHALAVGVSGVSKGGQVLYKVSGSLNNRGKFAAGLGIGYQFGKKEDKADENAKKMNDMMNKIKELEKIVKESKNDKYETKLYTINQFGFDSIELTKTQIIKLKDIVKEINEKYSDRTIDITGFADITGKEGYNLDLGLDRANKVAELMIEYGLKNPRNIRKVSSFGYNNKVSKSTDQNRRVEIEIK